MNSKTVAPEMVQPSAADERWVTWVARGVAQDRQSQKYARAIAVIVGVGLAVAFARLLLAG